MGRRTALITGGASGIGAAAARRLAGDDVRVITVDLDQAADHVVDVGDAAEVRALATEVGPVDILVNCAGRGDGVRPLWEIQDEEWERVLRVNLTGTFHFCREFVPGMIERGWGRIINVASLAGKEGNPRQAAYSASKAGVIALTKALGKELATTGVLANAIAPGVIDTPLVKGADQEQVAMVVGNIPMRRMGRAEEVAELIAWLASDKVSYSTGFTYDISGGRATY